MEDPKVAKRPRVLARSPVELDIADVVTYICGYTAGQSLGSRQYQVPRLPTQQVLRTNSCTKRYFLEAAEAGLEYAVGVGGLVSKRGQQLGKGRGHAQRRR